MTGLVTLTEQRLGRGRGNVFAPGALPAKPATPAEVAPLLRGLAAIPEDPEDGSCKVFVLESRRGLAILNFINGAEVARYSQVGVITPDHGIRTKAKPLLVPAPEAGKLADFAAAAKSAFARFAAEYKAYFERHNPRAVPKKKMLDTVPRVILVPGVGLFALGKSSKDARIAADVAENAVTTITDAEALARFETIPEAALFPAEYSSLEQAKLGKEAEKPLARQIALITRGASGIRAPPPAPFPAPGARIVALA